MPGLSRTSSVWLPVAVILIAMLSIQSGASLAKSLFRWSVRPGDRPAYRAGHGDTGGHFQTLASALQKAAFTLLFYGLSLGAMNYMFYLSIRRYRWDCRRAGVYRPAGGGAFLLPTSGRFYLGRVGRTGLMVPAAAGPDVSLRLI
jgi:hypothetical protein